MKPVLLTSLLFATSLFSFAQQEPNSVFFWNNYLHTNPAMTGTVYKHQASVTWQNDAIKEPFYSGAYPQTVSANYAVKLDRIHSGIGVSYRYDSPTMQQFQTALLSYAYHIPIKSMFLSIGVSGGIKTLNMWMSNTNASGDELVKVNYNPAFTSDFGIALRHEKWNVGISMTQWNRPALRLGSAPYSNYNLAAYLWLFADYRFALGENWSLTPRVQFGSDNQELYSNIQVLASWKANLWFGSGVLSYIMNGSTNYISLMAGYDIKGRFRLGYAAKISMQNNYPGIFMPVTHEAVFSFLLK